MWARDKSMPFLFPSLASNQIKKGGTGVDEVIY
uniref:Uncharacterized protein n=1 Tax=Rhizophora mucronata TaxID=61149 RepID=A0A2P2NDR6_RHIMU